MFLVSPPLCIFMHGFFSWDIHLGRIISSISISLIISFPQSYQACFPLLGYRNNVSNIVSTIVCIQSLIKLLSDYSFIIKQFFYSELLYSFKASNYIFGLFVQLLCISYAQTPQRWIIDRLFCRYIIPWNFSITFSVRG